MNLENWKRQARAHWKEFQPKRYKALLNAGTLDTALTYTAEQTHREMSSLADAGLTTDEAWERTRLQGRITCSAAAVH